MRSMALTARVGWLARMIIVGPCRVDDDVLRQACLINKLPKYTMRGGAAANIAHAEKQDAVWRKQRSGHC
jgi:hypothetical protein